VAAEQARLRVVTREIADCAVTQMKGTIEEAGVTIRQLLKDVQARLHNSIAGEAILRATLRKLGSSSAGHTYHHRIQPGASSCNVLE
jgi:hypothetical protein